MVEETAIQDVLQEYTYYWGFPFLGGALDITNLHFLKNDFTLDEVNGIYPQVARRKPKGFSGTYGYILVMLSSGESIYVRVNVMNDVKLPHDANGKTIRTNDPKKILNFVAFGYH